MILLVYCKYDTAGLNIMNRLKEKINFKRLKLNNLDLLKASVNGKKVVVYPTEESIINFQIPDFPERVDLVLCASKHASKSGLPVLTTHTPGNFSSAEFGGAPFELSVSNPIGLKKALNKLSELNSDLNLNFQVSYEVTHHGPTLPHPVQFIEVGSTKREWKNTKAALIASEAVLEVIKSFKPESHCSIGVGGGHYAPSFTKIGLETDNLVGHIIPKYKIKELRKEVFKKTAESNLGKCDSVIVDWKGVPGAYRGEIIRWAADQGLKVYKTREIIRN